MKKLALLMCLLPVALMSAEGGTQRQDFDLRYIAHDKAEAMAISEDMLSTGIEAAYRTDSEKQQLWIFQPDDLSPGERRACIFFIHGGGWGGSPAAFAPQCLYFSRRGLIAVSIHFRGPKDPPGSGSPKNCLADARSAYRWIREHANDYQIDPDRIVVGGGSAGAHLALSLVTISLDDIDNIGDNMDTPIDPKALILYNPAIDLVDGWSGGQKKCIAANIDPKTFSPAHAVKPGLPDTLIISGTRDHVISPQMIREFEERMKASGNVTTFIEYPDVGHSFFNYSRPEVKGAYFIETCERVQQFLAERQFIDP